jgi:hypothetical protein
MKRLFVLLALIAIVFASCKKYETSEELDLNTLPTVTLKGTVYADLDENVVGLEVIPEKVQVRASVPYSDYFTGTQSTGKWISEAVEVDSEGNFSLNVPVLSKGVNATISFSDFTYNVKKSNSVGQEYTVLRHFTCKDTTISGLGKGEANQIIKVSYSGNVMYSDNDKILTPEKEVTVRGKLTYRSDDTVYNKEVPSTTVTAIITLKNYGGSKEYKVTKSVSVPYGGNYELTVPMVERGEATVLLKSEGFWVYTESLSGNKRYNCRYELDGQMIIYNFAEQNGKDFTYTKGSYVSGPID